MKMVKFSLSTSTIGLALITLLVVVETNTNNMGISPPQVLEPKSSASHIEDSVLEDRSSTGTVPSLASAFNIQVPHVQGLKLNFKLKRSVKDKGSLNKIDLDSKSSSSNLISMLNEVGNIMLNRVGTAMHNRFNHIITF